MGRISFNEVEKFFSSNGFVSQFKPEPGRSYRILIPEDPTKPGDPIVYGARIHEINLGKIRGRARCLKDEYPIDFYVDGKVNPKYIDKATGKPMYDGTCPYCELAKLYQLYINQEVENFKKTESDEQKLKEFYRKLKQGSPARFPKEYIGFLVAVYETDTEGKTPVLDIDIPKYKIQFLVLSKTQFEKLKPIIVQYEQASTIEVILSYPAGELMQSVRDMTMIAPRQLFIEKYPKLLEHVKEQLMTIDLNTVDQNVLPFRLEPIDKVKRKIANVYVTTYDKLGDSYKSQVEEVYKELVLQANPAEFPEILGEGEDEDSEGEALVGLEELDDELNKLLEE